MDGAASNELLMLCGDRLHHAVGAGSGTEIQGTLWRSFSKPLFTQPNDLALLELLCGSNFFFLSPIFFFPDKAT